MSSVDKNANGASKNEAPKDSQPSQFPMFYEQPEALTPERHEKLHFKADAGFSFTRKAHVVPLNVAELAAASRYYPIVFIGEETPLPVAVLGLRKDQNLFVDPAGKWREDTYIPSYIRRYPFVFVTNNDQSQFSLCVDLKAKHIGEKDGVPLFKNKEPSEATRNALEFCRVYQGQAQTTREVGKAIAKQKLLTTNQANINLPSGEKLSVTDFQVIDEAKFNQLSDKDFLSLRQAGAIAAIYCQMISTGNWEKLVKLSAE